MLELRRVPEVRIETGGKPIGAREGKNRRAGNALDANLHGRISCGNSVGSDGTEQIRGISSGRENDSSRGQKLHGNGRIAGHIINRLSSELFDSSGTQRIRLDFLFIEAAFGDG